MHRPIVLRTLLRLLAALALACAGAAAWAQAADPPGRVATLTGIEGVTLFAPAGETQWTDAVSNRPITNGDRLRTEADARAELHLGTAVLHMDSRTMVEISALDQASAQFALSEGSVNVRVRELDAAENFEIGTPQLALRAAEPGDFRIDVDTAGGFTRVTVRAGAATVYGASGSSMRVQPGQQTVFIGRELTPLAGVPAPLSDAFDSWAAERNRAEDESIAARHVPREVVGYPELDRYGSWSQDATYGAVWYPQVAVAGWAPYRYGRWEWIAPWGWTWIDDAPWGFAPFHYGRWAIIGSRWAWVPGPLGPRPVYAPALVAFVGGQGWNLAVGSGPGIGWYPLAPGEVWHPFFNASTVYVRNVNRYVVPAHRHHGGDTHFFQRRPEAITAVAVKDFHRGVPIGHRWARVEPSDAARARAVTPPAPSPAARPGNDRARPGLRIVTQPLVPQAASPASAAPARFGQPASRQPEVRQHDRHPAQQDPPRGQLRQIQPPQLRQPEIRPHDQGPAQDEQPRARVQQIQHPPGRRTQGGAAGGAAAAFTASAADRAPCARRAGAGSAGDGGGKPRPRARPALNEQL